MSFKRNRRRRITNPTKLKRACFRPQSEPLESRLLLASDWTNPVDIYDVDASDAADSVSPLDAMIVINELNNPTITDPETGALPELTVDDADPTLFFDVNGDGKVSPLDALMVVNKLNENSVMVADTGQYAAAGVIVGTQAAHEVGIGDDTLVNTTTSRIQRFPDVASTVGGSSVVVWQSLGQDGSSWGIFGQRFDASGAAVGSEFQVNTTTRGAQTSPAVAMNDNGGFAVVWDSTDGSGMGVYAREFGADGAAVGDEVLVNTTTRGKQCHADVAYAGDDFTVVWQGRGQGDVNGIYARTFSGGTGGAETLVNSTTRGFQGHPTVGANANGVVAVAWEGRGEGDHYGIFMNALGSTGQEIMVNVDSSRTQRTPSIAVAADNSVTVAWHNPPNGIWARHFFASGDRSGIIQVSQTDPGIQARPAVAALAGGGFGVAWHGKGIGDNRGSFVRTFDGTGTATSGETLVNHTTRAAQVQPAIAAANDGYIVAWQGRGEGDRHGTFARFFETEVTGPFTLNAVADATVAEGSTFSTTVSVTDTANPGTGSPVFTLGTAPTGATINASTGVVTWVTTEADGPGTYEFSVTATEGDFNLSDTFNVTVTEVNADPVLAQIQNVNALVGSPVNISTSASDSDVPAQTLTLAATGTPSWLTFDAATGTFIGTPTAADEGTSTITVTANDGAGGSASQTFTVTATGNQVPTVATAIPDTSVNEGDALNLNVAGNFTDPDAGDTLTFATTSLPSWASLNTTTGAITGTPGNANVGSTNVTITANDGNGGSVSDTFQLTVVDVNTLTPTLLESSFRVAPTAANGTSVGNVFAQDLDPSSSLTYSFTSGNEAGAFAINASTGEITVADTTALAGLSGQTGLTVQATDGTNATTGPTTIVVDSTSVAALYSLSVVDPNNGDAVLTTVNPGQTIHLVLRVQGTGDGSQGVFSAFADIVYNPDTVTLAGDVVHDPTYNAGVNAEVDVAGLINEAGGSDGLTPLGSGVEEVLRVPMTIANVPAGTTIAFDTNFSEGGVVRATTIFGNNNELPQSRQGFSGTSVTVATPQAALNAVVDAVFAEDDDEEDA